MVSEVNRSPVLEGFLEALGRNDELRRVAAEASVLFGEELVREIPRLLAQSLGVRFVFVGEVVQPGNSQVRTLSFWAGDQFMDEYVYDLADTPCDHVFGKETCYYPSNVQELFPLDEDLKTFGIQGYAGAPLFSVNGDALGLIVALHDAPLENAEEVMAALSAFAPRVAAELEQMYARRTIETTEQRFASLFGHTTAGVAIADAQGRIIRNNEALEDFLGYPPQGLLNRRFTEFTDPRDAEKERALAAPMRNGEAEHYRLEKRFLTKDGETVWGDMSIAAVRDEDGRLVNYVGVAVDLTERKTAERELREALDQLTHANAELARFAHAVSHELLQPVVSMEGFSRLLAEKGLGAIDEEADEYIELIVEGARRTHAMITDLRSYVRLDSDVRRFVDVDAGEVAREALAKYKEEIERLGAAVKLEWLPTVAANKRQIFLLFENLIGNAIAFRNPMHALAIEIGAERREDEWVFCIRDNGIGIDRSDENQIFQVFQRLHKWSDRPGAGVGLSLCKRIVERHGGKIWLESELNRGSAFFFTVPA